jgi:hypothetical protein
VRRRLREHAYSASLTDMTLTYHQVSSSATEPFWSNSPRSQRSYGEYPVESLVSHLYGGGILDAIKALKENGA